MKDMLELYNIHELPDDVFTLYFKLIDRYQKEDPFLLEKLECPKYQKGYFRGGCNPIKLVTYKDKVVVPYKLQKYFSEMVSLVYPSSRNGSDVGEDFPTFVLARP